MKILVFSDVHNRHQTIHKIVEKHKDEVDLIISLGDWLDNFGEKIEDVTQTVKLLKSLLQNDKFIWVAGNHDLWYCHPKSQWVKCSGNTVEKAEIFKKIMGEDAFKYRLYYDSGDFLFSHAGIHPYLLPPEGYSEKWLEERCKTARIKLESGQYDSFLTAGYSRGGREPIGGITWQDWDDDFIPVPGLNQIVGHTIRWDEKVDIKRGQESTNYCIDTCNKHYLIITDGKVEVYEC